MLRLALFLAAQVDLSDAGETSRFFTPATAVPGDLLTIECDVANPGAAPSGTFWIDFYLSLDTTIDALDFYLGSARVADVPAGGVADAGWSGVLPSGIAAGTYYVGWILDSADAVLETDETNNSAYRTAEQLTVPGATGGGTTPPPTSTPAPVDEPIDNACGLLGAEIVLLAFLRRRSTS